MVKPKTIPELLDEAVGNNRSQLVAFMNAAYPWMKSQDDIAGRMKLRKEFEVIVAKLQKKVIELESKLKRKREKKN